MLKDLPTLVETHKTLDSVSYYKVADVGQVLEVSNVKETPTSRRPTFAEIDNSIFASVKSKTSTSSPKKRKVDDYVDDNGLTPPTFKIKQKLAKLDDDSGIDPKEVAKIDGLFVELEAEVTKRERSAEEASKPFVFDELVDEEPYMEYWDEVTVLDQGKDDFVSSAKKAYDLAYERYLQKHPHLDTRNKKKTKKKTEEASDVPSKSQSEKKSTNPVVASPERKSDESPKNVTIESATQETQAQDGSKAAVSPETASVADEGSSKVTASPKDAISEAFDGLLDADDDDSS